MGATKKKPSVIDAFMALSDAEKERIFASFEPGRPRPEGREPTPAEQAQLDRARKRGRPAAGEGAEAISLTVERGLLRRADAFAERTGLTRARLVAIALENLLPKGAAADPATRKVPAVRRRAAARLKG